MALDVKRWGDARYNGTRTKRAGSKESGRATTGKGGVLQQKEQACQKKQSKRQQQKERACATTKKASVLQNRESARASQQRKQAYNNRKSARAPAKMVSVRRCKERARVLNETWARVFNKIVGMWKGT